MPSVIVTASARCGTSSVRQSWRAISIALSRSGTSAVSRPTTACAFVGVAGAIEIDYDLIVLLLNRRVTLSVIALAARGAGGELGLIAEYGFRCWRSLFPLRLSDFAIASFLSLSHDRTSFRQVTRRTANCRPVRDRLVSPPARDVPHCCGCGIAASSARRKRPVA